MKARFPHKYKEVNGLKQGTKNFYRISLLLMLVAFIGLVAGMLGSKL